MFDVKKTRTTKLLCIKKLDITKQAETSFK